MSASCPASFHLSCRFLWYFLHQLALSATSPLTCSCPCFLVCQFWSLLCFLIPSSSSGEGLPFGSFCVFVCPLFTNKRTFLVSSSLFALRLRWVSYLQHDYALLVSRQYTPLSLLQSWFQMSHHQYIFLHHPSSLGCLWLFVCVVDNYIMICSMWLWLSMMNSRVKITRISWIFLNLSDVVFGCSPVLGPFRSCVHFSVSSPVCSPSTFVLTTFASIYQICHSYFALSSYSVFSARVVQPSLVYPTRRMTDHGHHHLDYESLLISRVSV